MEHLIFILFSFVGVAAVLGSPINLFKSRCGGARNSYMRGEVIVLDDLHRTSFRKQ